MAIAIDKLLSDIRNEPEWRSEAAIEMDYYDNNQLSVERRMELERRGMEPVVRNVIAPAINALLGMEERNRQDWKVLADDEGDSDEAIALSRKLHEIERLSGADRACSDAFATQAKIGLGWVEVRDNEDPFGYPTLVQSVRWQEMWWDWRARHPLLDDARWIVRRKWFDVDHLEAQFPKQQDLIRNAIDGWPDWYSGQWEPGSVELATAYGRELSLSLDELEWRQAERKRLALFEVWYRQVEVGKVLKVPSQNLTVEFDRKNQTHAMLALTGLGEVAERKINRVRRAYWVGPHHLSDEPSPYTHGMFPYVPFFGFREDRSGVPYGLIRLQKSPQDEANRRLSKMDFLLNAKTLIADADAFADLDWAAVIEEAGQPDAALPLNPNRTNKTLPQLHDHRDMSAQQFAVLQDALKWVSEVGGIYQAMLGKTETQQSGVAINSLVEQGSTTQGELFGNYRLSRQRVGEMVLAQTKRMLEGQQVEVTVPRGPEKRLVVFNQRLDDGLVSNSLTALKTRVELADVPSTPTFRHQMRRELTELTKSLPPELQLVLIPSIVRSSDLDNKDEVATLLEQAMGRGQDQEDDPVQALNAQRAAALDQRRQQLELDAAQAKTDGERAKAQKLEAEIDQLRLEVEAMRANLTERAQAQQMQMAMLDGQIPIQAAPV